MTLKREHLCKCSHRESAHMYGGRFRDCRELECQCIIYVRTAKRAPTPPGAPLTIADRAMLAARRQRDRAIARRERYEALCNVMRADRAPFADNPTEWPWDELARCNEALADAERTVAELERGAGVPIIMDDERSTT